MRMPSADDSIPSRSLSPVAGLTAFLGGIRFILTTPSVWGYAAVPVVTALLLSCGLGVAGFAAADALATRLIDQEVARWAARIVAGLVVLALAALLGLALAQPLSGWALEAIARKQEEQLTGCCPPEPSFLRSLWIGVRCSLYILIVGGVSVFTLFAIGLVFPPAVVVTVPLKFLVVAWLLAWDLVDYPLGMRGLGARRRTRWARAHFGAFTVFGLAWAVVLLVPGIFLFVLPMGAAGAARLVAGSEREDG